MLNKTELKRQVWHSRRGMLELDVLLGPFAAHALPLISAEQQQVYVRLLSQQDPDLFTWFMGNATSDDKELASMVEQVKDYAQSSQVPA
jgi:antitoxin CptB